MEGNVHRMEEVCLMDRRRTTTLQECSHIIGVNGVARYNRETFRQLFLDLVSVLDLYLCHLKGNVLVEILIFLVFVFVRSGG